MENGPFIDGLPNVYLLKIVFFYSYLKSPEGKGY